MFLTFEGVDGAGKTTQAHRLRERFERDGREVLVVREPGGTALGEELRRILLDPHSGDLAPEVELLLFMAARAQLCRLELQPALDAGKVVISDRFLWSSVVYQGIVGGVGIDEALAVGRGATRRLEPDRTFLIDVDPEVPYRGLDDTDRMERRGLEFQLQVRAGFLTLAERFAESIVLIDGSGSVEQVHERVLAALEDCL